MFVQTIIQMCHVFPHLRIFVYGAASAEIELSLIHLGKKLQFSRSKLEA